MAGSSLAKKLLIKPGQRALVLNPPAGYLEALAAMLEGMEVSEEAEGSFDFVQLFAGNVEELERLAPAALAALKRDGLFWVAYPKGSSRVKTDLSRDVGWDALKRAGLRPVSLVSLDEVWSALRFRPLELVGR